MEMTQPSHRIHPLMAGAAVSVILVSLVGIAAITGVLPTSHGAVVEPARMASQAAVVTPISAPAPQIASAPAERNEGVRHKTVVHHRHVQQARAEPVQQYSQAPVYQQPAAVAQPVPPPVAQNSPVGIGIGAVVGGLLGHQVGGGNGKTLATIAGAVGGGYLGNEIAKKYP